MSDFLLDLLIVTETPYHEIPSPSRRMRLLNHRDVQPFNAICTTNPHQSYTKPYRYINIIVNHIKYNGFV